MKAADRPVMGPQMQQTAVSALIAAVLMLLLGFRGGFAWTSYSSTYDSLMQVFIWTLRIGGAAMLVSAVLCFLHWRRALAYDAAAAGAIGVLFIVTNGGMSLLGAADLTDLLFIVFGFFFLRSAWISWMTYRESAPLGGGSAEAAAAEPASEIKSPAVQHSRESRPQPADEVKAGNSRQAGGEPRPQPGRAAETQQRLERNLDEPPPGGFLADLGKSDQP